MAVERALVPRVGLGIPGRRLIQNAFELLPFGCTRNRTRTNVPSRNMLVTARGALVSLDFMMRADGVSGLGRWARGPRIWSGPRPSPRGSLSLAARWRCRTLPVAFQIRKGIRRSWIFVLTCKSGCPTTPKASYRNPAMRLLRERDRRVKTGIPAGGGRGCTPSGWPSVYGAEKTSTRQKSLYRVVQREKR